MSLSSCTHDFLSSEENSVNEEEMETKSGSTNMEPVSGIIVLGERMTNPYSIEIMQEAADSLLPEGAATLAVTDLYVRFLPADSVELSYLLDEEGLELFDYPMDYEILQEGEYYHDPSIPENEITWQYTTVKPDYVFPDIQYEIIEYCHVPLDLPLTRSGNDIDAEQLEKIAYEIAGVDSLWEDTPTVRASAEYPSGRFRVKDTKTSSYVPIKGVKVRVHNFIKWATAYTDENGDYVINKKYRTNVHYAMVFKNSKGFKIWGNWAIIAAANHNMGFQTRYGISRDIDVDSDAWAWATVNNAAWEYYGLCQTNGVTPPPSDLTIWCLSNRTWSSAIMIPHMSNVSVPSGLLFGMFDWLDIPGSIIGWFLPDLFISTQSNDTEIVYRTVCHEMSHASHYEQVGYNYWNRYIGYIVNCWAEDHSTTYGDGSMSDNGVCEVGEMWGYSMGYIHQYEKYYSIDNNTLYPGSEDYFFKPDVIWDIYRAELLDKQQIFAAMTNNVDDVMEFRNKLSSLYPSESTKIEMIFAEYDDNYDKADKIGEWVFRNHTDQIIYIQVNREWMDTIEEGSLPVTISDRRFLNAGYPLLPRQSVTIARLPYNNGKAFDIMDIVDVEEIAPVVFNVANQNQLIIARAILDGSEVLFSEQYGEWTASDFDSGKKRVWTFDYDYSVFIPGATVLP